MEINTVQTHTPAITPLQSPEATGTHAQETNTTENRQSPAATEAYRVSISAEARAEGETAGASTNGEEAQETETQETAEQVYTNTGVIA